LENEFLGCFQSIIFSAIMHTVQINVISKMIYNTKSW